MTYLGIDTVGAAVVTSALNRAAARIDPIQDLLVAAQQQADLVLPVSAWLDALEQDWRSLAANIDRALDELTRFRIHEPAPVTVQPLVSLTAPDSVTTTLRWSQVRQDASHNSYAVSGGIAGLYENGIRTFELDIHRGAPTDLTPPPGFWSSLHPLLAVGVDHLGHGGGQPNDWRVYHATGSTNTEYEYLSDGLQAIAALPNSDPLTVFIDNKDQFGGTHSPEQLDALVRAELGDRLITPRDLRWRAPDAGSLHHAVETAGWPTVAELQGRVFVVLTDQVGQYTAVDPALFVAPAPRFATIAGRTVHVPNPSAIFYNVRAGGISQVELAATRGTSSVVRTYFNPECSEEPLVNYRAIDATADSPPCLQERVGMRASRVD